MDAFTEKPFAGNPAAVCLLNTSTAERLTVDSLQQIAAENNQPATAFVSLLDGSASFKAASHFGLRWFSPSTELPLCGHGTLAAAAVLFQGLVCEWRLRNLPNKGPFRLLLPGLHWSKERLPLACRAWQSGVFAAVQHPKRASLCQQGWHDDAD